VSAEHQRSADAVSAALFAWTAVDADSSWHAVPASLPTPRPPEDEPNVPLAIASGDKPT
jgi:hypothetical protein